MSALSPLAEQTTGAIRVLHVDDEPDLADVTATFLERNDERFDVTTATSATEGLERLADTDVDCIISDYDMPGTNGIEFLEAVREDYPDLPFILFTGKGSEEVASDAISAGVTDYLQKETGSDQYAVLANRVSNAVDRYRSQHMVEQSERRLRKIIDAVPHILYVVDADGTYLLANEAQADFHDTTTDAIEGAHVSEILGEAAAKQFMGDLREVLDCGTSRRLTEVKLEDSNGKTHIFEPRLLPYDLGDADREAVLGIAVDVTDRHERARELERTRERTQLALEYTDSMIFEVDLDTGEVVHHGAFEQIFDRAADQAPTWEEYHDEMVHPDDQQQFHEFHRKLLDGDRNGGAIEYRTHPQHGDVHWIRAKVSVRSESAADARRAIGIARDVTERKTRERELERYEAYLEESTDIVTVLDAAGTIKYESPAVSRILGYETGELIGEYGFDYVHPDDRDEMFEAFSDLVAEPGETVTVQCRFRTADEEWRWLEVRGTNQLDHEAIEGVVTNNRDITARKEHEQELERTTSRLEALFEQSPDMINTHDADGNILDPNPRLIEKTGYDETELTDMKVWDLDQTMEPDTAVALWEEMEVGDRERGEGVFERRDGSTFPVEANVRRLDIDDEARFMVISRDVTERKRRETDLQRQRDRLEQFASIVSHDLRNPLNVASTRLELLAGECDSEHVAPIERAHDRMDGLIENLLTLAKNNERVTERESVPLETVAKQCWATVETTDATLTVDSDRAVRADESRLKQVFENLFRNAVEHSSTDSQPEADDVTITVGDLPDGFYVEDDGPGIPAEQREEVFEVGYSTNDGGTGFGLSIVEQIATAHDWGVEVTDAATGGTRIEVTGVEFVE